MDQVVGINKNLQQLLERMSQEQVKINKRISQWPFVVVDSTVK
jgi:hypothetical protein